MMWQSGLWVLCPPVALLAKLIIASSALRFSCLKTNTELPACSNTGTELVQSCDTSLCSVMRNLCCAFGAKSLIYLITHHPCLAPSSLSNNGGAVELKSYY